MKSLYLFLITTTVFISTSKFAYANDGGGFRASLRKMQVFCKMKLEQLQDQERIDLNAPIDPLNNNNSSKEGIDSNFEKPTQKKDD